MRSLRNALIDTRRSNFLVLSLSVVFAGTASANPSLIDDIYNNQTEYSYVDFYGQINDKLYYALTDIGEGTRLWEFDSTGAREVETDAEGNALGYLSPHWEYARKPLQYGQHIFFASGGKVYAIDDGGIQPLFDFEDSDVTTGELANTPFRGWDGTNLYIVEEVRNDEYWRYSYVDHYNVWKTDGTATGTQKVARFGSGSLPAVYNFTIVGDGIFYTKSDMLDNVYRAVSLWRYDIPTKSEKRLLEAPEIKDRWIKDLVVFNNTLYFSTRTQSNGRELWKTNATVKGTRQVADIHAGSKGSYPDDFQVFNNALYFSASDGDHGRQLWKTDGTTAGTIRVSDVQNGGKGAVEQLTVLKNKLFFVAEDVAHGKELWKTNGTRSGTALVDDINPGATDSDINTLVVGGNNLYFFANDGTHGQEVWTSNGSGATHLLADLYPGAEGSIPQYAVWSDLPLMSFFGGNLYFTADDGVHGVAPWKYVPTQPPAGTAAMGDFVWQDINGDGIQNSGEPGLANVKVQLRLCDGTFVKSTLTDNNGRFLFSNLGAKSYRLKFLLPEGYQFSPEKSTDLYELDSNANPVTGLTGCYDMKQGWQRLAIDAGMVPAGSN